MAMGGAVGASPGPRSAAMAVPDLCAGCRRVGAARPRAGASHLHLDGPARAAATAPGWKRPARSPLNDCHACTPARCKKDVAVPARSFGSPRALSGAALGSSALVAAATGPAHRSWCDASPPGSSYRRVWATIRSSGTLHARRRMDSTSPILTTTPYADARSAPARPPRCCRTAG